MHASVGRAHRAPARQGYATPYHFIAIGSVLCKAGLPGRLGLPGVLRRAKKRGGNGARSRRGVRRTGAGRVRWG
ncbi:hypothetical protein GCM10018962_97260 [Dactylosporangium matsuzakiense]|uniref:Uncharacterized protein n=1 Tax=Dactylosporangium matsuzakiense TaxID=53360 RepID=A0A9W6NN51_9ACTN|nr:hypothetical protein GCM10017581_046050 [Dactylosporangium matsuzakiense]